MYTLRVYVCVCFATNAAGCPKNGRSSIMIRMLVSQEDCVCMFAPLKQHRSSEERSQLEAGEANARHTYELLAQDLTVRVYFFVLLENGGEINLFSLC